MLSGMHLNSFGRFGRLFDLDLLLFYASRESNNSALLTMGQACFILGAAPAECIALDMALNSVGRVIC
jgi:hypothetical protein